MQLQDFYVLTGGDFAAVKGRFFKEEMIERFVLRFLEDPSFGELSRALEGKTVTEAFRAAHTLKGVCSNLGFDRLGNSSSELTEYLRGREQALVDWEQCRLLFGKVAEDYGQVTETIRQLDSYMA